jgi:hypothetical protein
MLKLKSWRYKKVQTMPESEYQKEGSEGEEEDCS